MLIHKVGGAFVADPSELLERLSPEARALVERAFEDIDSARLLDYHVHIVGLGQGDTGAWVSPELQTWRHPIKRLTFAVYASAAGIEDVERADAQYAARLARLARAIPRHGRYLILGFDRNHDAQGRPDLRHTEFFVPNEYAFALAREHPDVFVAAASIHPYREDALAELDRWAAQGARMVKWLPNAMNIDAADPRCDPFYARMKALGLVLLCHAGEEKAVDAKEAQALGNPLRLRRPLEHGLKVVVAHCASLGDNEDLDDPARRRRPNFELFMRLMDDQRYEGQLFGEISATTQFNRLPGPLSTLLAREDLHHRLVNGSDYPLPAINIIVRTKTLARAGLIAKEQRRPLKEIYTINPLLFDYVVKRTARSPETGRGFPPEVFMMRKGLEPWGP